MDSTLLPNLHHAFAQTDGTYAFPNSREGDMLKTAKREIEQLLAERAQRATAAPAFNQLTPAQSERLAILVEECGEVIQVVGKILRHGYESRHPDGGPTNREMLEIELADIEFAQSLLCANGDANIESIAAYFQAKRKRRTTYLHHASP